MEIVRKNHCLFYIFILPSPCDRICPTPSAYNEGSERKANREYPNQTKSSSTNYGKNNDSTITLHQDCTKLQKNSATICNYSAFNCKHGDFISPDMQRTSLSKFSSLIFGRHQFVRICRFSTQLDKNYHLIDPTNFVPGCNRTAIFTENVSKVGSKKALPLNC